MSNNKRRLIKCAIVPVIRDATYAGKFAQWFLASKYNHVVFVHRRADGGVLEVDEIDLDKFSMWGPVYSKRTYTVPSDNFKEGLGTDLSEDDVEWFIVDESIYDFSKSTYGSMRFVYSMRSNLRYSKWFKWLSEDSIYTCLGNCVDYCLSFLSLGTFKELNHRKPSDFIKKRRR